VEYDTSYTVAVEFPFDCQFIVIDDVYIFTGPTFTGTAASVVLITTGLNAVAWLYWFSACALYVNTTSVDRFVTHTLLVQVLVVLYTAVELNPPVGLATYPVHAPPTLELTFIAYCVQYGLFVPAVFIVTAALVIHTVPTVGAGGTAANVTVDPKFNVLLGIPE
jgi:hypothetical protein